MRTRIALALSGLLVASLALSACGAPTPTPTSSPTATATPSSLEAPLSRLPLACDELVHPSTVAGFAGESVPLLSDGSRPDSWWDVVWRQSGAIRCEWGPDRDNVTLSVYVVPNAQGAFDDYVSSIWQSYYERYDAVGDRSVHSCAYGQCSFSILVGDYVVNGFAQRFDLMDELDLEPIMRPVLEELAGAVASAIPDERPAWVPPEGALRGWGWAACLDEAPVAELAAVVGMTDPFTPGTDYDAVTWAVFDQVQPSQCTLASENTGDRIMNVALVEGGAWVVDQWETTPPLQWSGQPLEPIPVEGMGTAYLGVDGGYHTLLFALEGSFVSFSTQSASREEFLGWAAEVAEILVAHAP